MFGSVGKFRIPNVVILKMQTSTKNNFSEDGKISSFHQLTQQKIPERKNNYVILLLAKIWYPRSSNFNNTDVHENNFWKKMKKEVLLKIYFNLGE